MVPVDRLEEVKRILDAHGHHYWVDKNAISSGGRPAVALINLGHGADIRAVEQLLERNHVSAG